MGTSMRPALPVKEWLAISSQNIWEGVIFAGNSTARIFPQPEAEGRGKSPLCNLVFSGRQTPQRWHSLLFGANEFDDVPIGIAEHRQIHL